MKTFARRGSIALIVVTVGLDILFHRDVVDRSGERSGYVFPIMTDSGLAYTDLWGGLLSYAVVAAFLIAMIAWSGARRDSEEDR